MPRSSSSRLRERLADRPDLGRERALADIGAGLPIPDVTELAELLEVELGVPLGLLRASDRLDALLAPFAVGNLLSWLFAEAALEDGVSEINYRLKRRLQRRGVALKESPPTVRDLFEVWCGPPAA